MSPSTSPPSVRTTLGRILRPTVLGLCLAILVRQFVVEPVEVISGSMAPCLRGPHHSRTCPFCGGVEIRGMPTSRAGKGIDLRDGTCRHCGATLSEKSTEYAVAGDQVVVNRLAYLFEAPERWDVVVFHLFGDWFIKRLAGLPGEEILIRGGDIHADGRLVRKSFEQVVALRVPLVDREQAVRAGTWPRFWTGDYAIREGGVLSLDGRRGWTEAAFSLYSARDGKCVPALDESLYAGSQGGGAETVHDFSARLELHALEPGLVRIILEDGQDEAVVELALGEQQSSIDNHPDAKIGRCGPVGLGRHVVEVAFVDRRLQARVNGKEAFAPVDFPPSTRRRPVVRPLRLEVRGARMVVSDFALFRDVHYRGIGRNGVEGRSVRLGPNEYFVLGDNSPASEDSRFWPGGGGVPGCHLIGRVFFRHAACRSVSMGEGGEGPPSEGFDRERLGPIR